MPNLIGLHDAEAVAIAYPDSWILNLAALSERPQPPALDPRFHWITRLGWGYGTTGCLPLPAHYPAMAERAAQYVSRSSGCRRWVIGNESNLAREWPAPEGLPQPIYPWHYAAAYKLCRQAIHALPGHQYDDVLIAGSGPWNAELKYPENPDGDWITYFSQVIELCTPAIDGFAIHAYTHGYDPALVISTDRMDNPFHNRFYNFLTYRDYCDAIPTDLHHLPVYLTEANGNSAWEATGLMPAMLDEIDKWNWGTNKPKIHCVVFYRWPKYDQYYIDGRGDVIAEYQGAAAAGYESPAQELPDGNPPGAPDLPEPEPEPTPPDNAEYLVEWDPRLDARGTMLLVAAGNAPTEWHVRVGRWYDEAQSQGRHNVFVSVLDEQGEYLSNVPVRFIWQDGEEVKETEIKHDPWLGQYYSLDFALYNPAPAYGVQIDDEEPTDIISGLGLGDLANPQHNIHTSYFFEFQRIATKPQPAPVPPHTEYCIEPRGANLRDAPVDGDILITVPYRHAVTAAGEVEGSDGWMWQECTYGDYSGYIRSDLISPKQPATIVPQPPQDNTLIWPVQTGRVTQWFGDTSIDYSRWGIPAHDGIDIAAPTGTPVYCVGHGRVVAVGDDPEGFGLFIRVFHEADGFHSLYGHLSRQMVYVGDLAVRGKQIGEVGSTGNSSGPHLHFSFRVGSEHDYYRVHTGHKQGASDPMAIYSVINRSDPNLLLP